VNKSPKSRRRHHLHALQQTPNTDVEMNLHHDSTNTINLSRWVTASQLFAQALTAFVIVQAKLRMNDCFPIPRLVNLLCATAASMLSLLSRIHTRSKDSVFQSWKDFRHLLVRQGELPATATTPMSLRSPARALSQMSFCRSGLRMFSTLLLLFPALECNSHIQLLTLHSS
jgi:hypothetical protein